MNDFLELEFDTPQKARKSIAWLINALLNEELCHCASKEIRKYIELKAKIKNITSQ
ncbi:MAG: hypothetical protein FWC41_00230 [Firmicutes bacterium]|nr:hypothetical protein [Bacillota bacterium]